MSITLLHHPSRTVRFGEFHAHAGGSATAERKVQCSSCHLRELCLPCGMEGSDIERLDDMKFSRHRVKTGQTLYRDGDRFDYIYAVRSGTFKTSLDLADGREQVSGFYLGGELMGLDGVAHGHHASSATALEDAEVCAIPYAHLTELSAANAGMQHMVSRLMSREIVREHSLMLLLGSMNAEERLAAFLLNLSQRLKARGYSPTEFHLRMSRAEIGSYLGMKLETVSRTFSAFQQHGLLEVDKRHIRIADMQRLTQALDMRARTEPGTAMKHLTTRIIQEEHAALAAMLQSLLAMLHEQPGDEPERFFDVVRAMLFYIDEFPERRHHPKESDLLFPRLARARPDLLPVIHRLEDDHMKGEPRVRELQHLLLAWELLGESRRPAFEKQLRDYVGFYLEHMATEESQVMPAAEQALSAADWEVLDAAFSAQRDPLAGGMRDPHYDRLFTRIVRTAPAPIGVGQPLGKAAPH